MKTNRAFIVTLSLPVESLTFLDQLAVDLQADIIDAGHDVVSVKPWSSHSTGQQELTPPAPPEDPPGGFPGL